MLFYPQFGYFFPEAEQFGSAGDCDKVHHIFLVDTPSAYTLRTI